MRKPSFISLLVLSFPFFVSPSFAADIAGTYESDVATMTITKANTAWEIRCVHGNAPSVDYKYLSANEVREDLTFDYGYPRLFTIARPPATQWETFIMFQ